MDNAEHTLFVCARWGVSREAVGRAMNAHRVIRHPGDEEEGARWACGARGQRGPVEIASGPAPAVLRPGRTWLSASFGGEIILFLPWLARLVGLPNGRVAADGKSVSYTEKIVEVISISIHAGVNGSNLRLGHT